MVGLDKARRLFAKGRACPGPKLKARAWRRLDSGCIFCIVLFKPHLKILISRYFFWSQDSRSRDFRPTLFSFVLFQSENKTFLSNFVTNHSGNGTETFFRWRNLRAKNFKVRSIFLDEGKTVRKTSLYPHPLSQRVVIYISIFSFFI